MKKIGVPYINMTMRNNKGFTLVELLLVIIIMGILIVMGLTSFLSSQKKSRDIKRKQDLRQVALSLEAYYSDKGKYPTGNASGVMVGCSKNDAQTCDWDGTFQDMKGTTYMVKLPTDTSPARYYYISATGSQYQLYARLENLQDGDIPKNGSGLARAFSDISCNSTTGAYCNYGISSPNASIVTGRSLTYE